MYQELLIREIQKKQANTSHLSRKYLLLWTSAMTLHIGVYR